MLADVPSALWACLFLLLTIAIFTDLRSRIIPNWLTALVALLGLWSWIASGMSFWPDMAVRLGQAAVVLGLFAIVFVRGGMGGGDVKLIAGLALWFPLWTLLSFLIVMSLIGGVLSLIFLAKSRLSPPESAVEVPYGVAIALAGFWVIAEQFGMYLRVL